ncbi:MAG: hypothetical protein BWY89_01685 [Bacteroidetes bacterium ADurb.BinA012]|nr:MAG: hypothetical protein BWY89_01685 [Bacteroidetes bacterium ADurb.BinA012]
MTADAFRKSETFSPPHDNVKRLNSPPAKNVIRKKPARPIIKVPAETDAINAPKGLPRSPARPMSKPSARRSIARLFPNIELRNTRSGSPTARVRTRVVTQIRSISLYEDAAAAAPFFNVVKKFIPENLYGEN